MPILTISVAKWVSISRPVYHMINVNLKSLIIWYGLLFFHWSIYFFNINFFHLGSEPRSRITICNENRFPKNVDLKNRAIFLHASFWFLFFIRKNKLIKCVKRIHFFTFCLAASWPTLGHSQEDSLNYHMLITVFFNPKATGNLVTRFRP